MVFFLFPLALTCMHEPDSAARNKLQVLLRDDLKVILEGVAADGLLENPSFTIVSYKTYNEGNYSALSVVDFYFLKSSRYKIVRKYRYVRMQKSWERFYNAYQYDHHDTLSVKK